MPSDVESIWLKINYFFLTNRDDLKKWWVILLIAADVFFVVFLITNSVVYVLGTAKQKNFVLSMVNSPLDYPAIREDSQPASLEIITTTAILNANNQYDLLAQIKNPNKGWVVESIKYKFIVSGESTDSFTDYIMPNSDKFLTMLSTNAANIQGSASVSMEIEEIIWQRVPNIDKLVKIDFTIEDIEYSPFASFAGNLVHNVDAKVTNNSFKSFWQTRFIVVLYNGANIIGINYVYFDDFKAGSTNNLKAQWTYLQSTPTNIVILPDMDLTDVDNIIQ